MGRQIVEGPPCGRCGYRTRTVFEGLPDDIAAMLREYLDKSGLTRAELSRRAGLSTNGSYLANLLAGTARPSKPVARDLIMVLQMSWVDGQRLLEAAGSERDRRTRRST